MTARRYAVTWTETRTFRTEVELDEAKYFEPGAEVDPEDRAVLFLTEAINGRRYRQRLSSDLRDVQIEAL